MILILNGETPNEWTTVERPLLQQLVAMGWEYLEGNLDYPQKTFRNNFREVLLQDHLSFDYCRYCFINYTDVKRVCRPFFFMVMVRLSLLLGSDFRTLRT